jgi:3-hydroxyisobutyrate dehydrogenase/2-hydroxy-3-oxopropionate reductase
MKVAVLGTGAMGSAMARALARQGLPPTLWNRSPDRAVQLADELGSSVASSPAAAVRDVDVAITMLADRPAVEQVYRGPQGILAGAHQGLIACEMSTVEPQVSIALAAELRSVGADLIDAPVSGSVGLAERGELTLMVGGDARVLDRARPVLDALGQQVLPIGEVGSGAAMKLAVNSVLHGLNEAVAEALVLAERAGIDPATAYDVFQRSAAGAPFVQYKRDAYVHPQQAAVAFRLALARKDVRLILDLAASLGVVMTQAEANLAVLDAAVDEYGERDMSALATYLRTKARPLAAAPSADSTEVSS